MHLSMISTSDPALWRPDTFLFGHTEVGCGHRSEIFFDVFLKPMGSAFEPLGYTGRVFVQSAGKLAGIAVRAEVRKKQLAVGFGQCIESGAIALEALLHKEERFGSVLR